MILSHRYRCIFVKTRKTAGTSLEIGLSRFCGPEDVITRNAPDDQRIRDELGYPGPQNEYGIALRHYRFGDWRRRLMRGTRARFENHMTAARLRRIVGETTWRDYFRFTVERNPWDKAVSLYFWRTRDMASRPTLLEYLKAVPRRSLSNFHVYSTHGALAVDRVIRYEHLAEDLEAIRVQLGIPEPIEMPRAKGQHRPDNAHCSALVGPREKAIIDRACAREIEQFGYTFEQCCRAEGARRPFDAACGTDGVTTKGPS